MMRQRPFFRKRPLAHVGSFAPESKSDAAKPGPIRWHYRQKINALVYQAMVE